ncbi:condensation domain-containing protein, partial [Streptomyces litmocidini]|uniref:condensation domain-containing protein n=1 Tax=Streptomyces litmocidini TaxID=67318 RepID=UPI0027E44893
MEGEPRQRVLPPESARVSVERRHIEGGALEGELAAAAGRVFDLSVELPLRAVVFELGDGVVVLSLVVHHIATDGLSNAVFFGDLQRAYEARLAGEEGRVLEPLTVQYADYAVWQRRVLGSADDPESVLGRELGFWRGALEGLPEEHGLNLDRPRPARASHRGGQVELDLGADLFERIAVLARSEGCTPFMVVHAALVAALTRLGAGTDLAIGSPTAGRGEPELQDLVGFFVNTLVLRTSSAGDPSFRELLGRVRTADLDAFAHQEAPFDLVLEAVNPTRSLSRHPLFQISLGLETDGGPAFALSGVRTGPVEKVSSGSAKFDLEFFLRSDDEKELRATVLFAAELFDEVTVRRTVTVLGEVLAQALDEPDRRLSDLKVLSEAERELLTGPWAGAVAEVGDATLVERFEEQAARFPDGVALVDEAGEVTYAELNAAANRWARHLRSRGLGRGDMAGVLWRRGAEFASVVIGVLKTGAGYTLLDPDFPDERLRSAATDAGIGVLVAEPGLADRLTGPWDTASCSSEQLAGLRGENLGTELSADDPACLMFTSGSTGRPKAILS